MKRTYDVYGDTTSATVEKDTMPINVAQIKPLSTNTRKCAIAYANLATSSLPQLKKKKACTAT